MERIIILFDDEKELLAKTNAPDEMVKKAIEHRDHCLDNDIYIESDFEEMKRFLEKNGYSLEEIGYVDELDRYYW